jgi:hypothetical protein
LDHRLLLQENFSLPAGRAAGMPLPEATGFGRGSQANVLRPVVPSLTAVSFAR